MKQPDRRAKLILHAHRHRGQRSEVSRIQTRGFPYLISELVCEIELIGFEGLQEADVSLIDPEGRTCAQEFESRECLAKGIRFLLPLSNVMLSRPGTHRLRLSIDEQEYIDVPIEVYGPGQSAAPDR